ncbi:MAG TPA: SDR family oxidoreductase [bacterium]|nr:SDR family oxidoreductase [bacterium]
MPETMLITGANRGLGLAISKALLEMGDRVFAACREPQKAEELKALAKAHPGQVEIVALDPSNDRSPFEAAKAVASKTDHLDLLFNNAGVSPQPYDAPLDQVGLAQMREAFEVNTLGPLKVSQAFLPLLKKASNPRIVNMSTGLASLSGKSEGHFYAYGVSKAAMNMLTRTMAFDLQKDKVTCVCLDPGWVKTDMGGPSAPLQPAESAGAIAKTLKKLSLSGTGRYIYNDGNDLKW